LIINTFSQTEELWRHVHAEAIRHRPVLAVGYVSSLEQFARFLSGFTRRLPAGLQPSIEAGRRLLIPNAQQQPLS
jgi:hypothetical protein